MSRTRSSLLSRIKDLADGPSWEEFDRIYRRLLVRYALARGLNRDEAEEIAQQCMAALATGIQNFTRQVSFRGWLRGMVDRKVADHLRKRAHEVPARTRDLEREQTTEENPALVWERQWNRTHLLYWLNQIRTEAAPMTFAAFEMYVIQERPVAEIAERLGMTPNQIYVAKHRVLAKLRERWADVADGIL
jgi:RNA polymerase sigma factor (sigma-70 family)